jgi:hypothetical protein
MVSVSTPPIRLLGFACDLLINAGAMRINFLDGLQNSDLFNPYLFSALLTHYYMDML